MEKLIILTGPTGIGKTELSLEIAKKFKCQIISADSMQIYKKLDIGTDKINFDNTDIKHHMIDIVEPDEEFSVSDFQIMAKKIIHDLNKKNTIPLVVGGTGLYINSLVYDLDFSKSPKDDNLRIKLEEEGKKYGLDFLVDKLLSLDREAIKKVDLANKRRVIRALEIILNGGQKDNNFRAYNNDYDLIFIGLYMDRSKLYERINKRVDQMIDKGLVDEVKRLLDQGLMKNSQSLKAIGYKEVISYLKGQLSYDHMICDIKKNSRHYAKRQITWFKRDERIKWFNREEPSIKNQIINYIGERLGNLWKYT